MEEQKFTDKEKRFIVDGLSASLIILKSRIRTYGNRYGDEDEGNRIRELREKLNQQWFKGMQEFFN